MKKFNIVFGCVVIFVFALIQILFPTLSTATGSIKPSWLVGSAQYEEGNSLNLEPECTMKNIIIEGNRSRTYADNPQYINHVLSTEHNVCVYSANGYNYAQYRREYYMVPTYPSYGTLPEYGVAVNLPGGSNFQYAEGFGTKSSDVQLYFGNTTLFVQHALDGSDQGLRIYKNLPDHLHAQSDGTLSLDNEPDYRYTDTSGNDVSIYGLGSSINKRWISFGVRNFGIMTLNLDTLKVNRVSDRYDVQSWIWPTPQLVSSISDDGKYVVVGGMSYQTEVISVKDCGSELPANGFAYHSQLLGQSGCPYVNITELTTGHSSPMGGSGLRMLDRLGMSSSGDMFTYWDNYKWNTVYASNHLKPGQLYYLALGDSYASGEGDLTIDGIDHYLPGTNIYGNYLKNIPRETCHISTRSYPMRIAEAMQLTRGPDMESIACSGAVISDILASGAKENQYVSTDYAGQPTQLISSYGPRLNGITNAAQLQADARSNYTPGRVQQIELVKKSQPKYITIMAGGNDVDFGGIMTVCANNALPSDDETCDYAQGDGLAGEVKKVYDLYPKLVDFYKALKEVSPGSTVYVLGYPQFMDENNESCIEMINLYNKPERKAIYDLIAYANSVIRAAALDAGAKYIDISGALTGNELCASGTSMTGMTDLFATFIYTEYMRSLTMSDMVLSKYVNILPPSFNKIALDIYLTERAVQIAGDVLYSPATALANAAQVLSHPNAIGHEAIYDVIRQGLGDDMLDSALCNEQISCSDGGIIGRPDIVSYFPTLHVDDGIVHVSARGSVKVGHGDGKGKTILGALTKSLSDQFIQISAGLLDGAIDQGKPVIVEIHSQPIILGTMAKTGDIYELRTTIPHDVSVGQHVLHIKGYLVDGQMFDIDMPVFVEGPLGDIDDDGIADSIDTCAFGRGLGTDLDLDDIDDACEMRVSDQDMPTAPMPTASRAASSDGPILELPVSDSNDNSIRFITDNTLTNTKAQTRNEAVVMTTPSSTIVPLIIFLSLLGLGLLSFMHRRSDR